MTTKWYVGAMNDALFIINQKPSPSGTDVPPDTPHPGLKVIAKVESGEGYDADSRNANMLAASTEMYEALKEILQWDEVSGIDDEWPMVMKRVHSALAKAEGRGNG